MSRSLLALIACVGALAGGLLVWGYDRSAAPGGADRARIERVVHDYVLANPDIIPQAMQKLQEREAGKLVDAHRRAITTPFAGAWAGNPKGDVTIVEYFDYNCGYCRASLPMIAQLVAADPNLRIVYRELPILSEESRAAARTSLVAAARDRYAAFHEALYAGGPVSDATIANAAARAGIPVTPPADFAKTADAEIATNLETAAKLGITGTPSWVIGNRVLAGALPLEELQKAVAAARGK